VTGTRVSRANSPSPLRTPAHEWTAVLDGHRLRDLRRQRRLSQAELAYKAGISPGTVARLERQERARCRSRTLGRLSGALGADPTSIACPPTD
jgi:transcriptional regulator with XRE-family HTH domain